jgi:hypothetical protein
LFGDCQGQRIESGAAAACQNYSAHLVIPLEPVSLLKSFVLYPTCLLACLQKKVIELVSGG